jgi:hypothetical protein
MTSLGGQTSGDSAFADPPVWVRFGTMDHRAEQQAREVLQQASGRAGTNLVVDLTSLDPAHEIPMFVLLLEAVQVVDAHGGSVTALNPTGGLPTILVDAGVRVIWFEPPRSPEALTIDIGTALPALGAR